jgi:hypothetical protein
VQDFRADGFTSVVTNATLVPVIVPAIFVDAIEKRR